MIQIAVLGYGTVGSGVVEVINRNQESINKKAGEEINIKYVLDLRDFPGDPVQEKIVHDYEVIANDPEIKIVVEVMGGTNPAYTFVKRALESGKSVCTSNKELVAKHGVELIRIAKEKNCNFLFEASCGGGIPIIRPLNCSLTADEVDEISGILNGTTNYILSKMTSDGSEFEDVLKNAQDSVMRSATRQLISRAGMPAERSRFFLLWHTVIMWILRRSIPRESRRSLPRISVMQRHLAQPSSFWPAASGSGTSTMRWYARL